MQLTALDRSMLGGEHGPGVSMAMRLIVRLGEAAGADRLIDITRAHVDGALYIGPASLDYAARLRDLGALVTVPTTLNVSSLDLLHPELYRGDEQTRTAARATMKAYEDMGCRPTWTCAPYQLEQRPEFGERVAWAESNAIVFANSVLGARSERLGDFVDIAAAIAGRIPETGLYLDENRIAELHYDVSGLPRAMRTADQFFAVVGLVIGRTVGRRVPVVTGIEHASEDQMKELGAAAATAGSVGLIHVVGVTPEAQTLASACGGRKPETSRVTADMMRAAYESLSVAVAGRPLTTVNLGTPHYSHTQIANLTNLLGGRHVHEAVALYVNTGRDVLATVPNSGELADLGVQFVTDTCTYLTPIIEPTHGVAMTDSAKWAYYAPNNLGVAPIFASTDDCVESAIAGSVRRDRSWL